MQQKDKKWKWKWLNEDLQKFIKANDFYNLGLTYHEMANFVKDEGKDSAYLLELGYKTKLKFQSDRLKEYKRDKVCTGVEIIAVTNCEGNNACEVCRQFNGKVFSINEALSKNPLPIKSCSHECGCRCVYGPNVN